jgi:hypothetical protein
MTSALGLLDRQNRRALWRALRGNFEPTASPANPDTDLTEVLQRPFESLADTEMRLSRLEQRLRQREDRRAVFLSIYVRMTRQVREGIQNGSFEDGEWMRSYVMAFADHYRRAFLAFERGEEGVPDPWAVAFGQAIAGDTLVMQDAFLGVNAHINYDLALALDDVGLEPDRGAKYRDHCAINDVLADLVDQQQAMLADLYAPGVTNLDAVFGEFDEALTLLSMTEGREQAWRVACVSTDVGWPLVDTYARWLLRTTALGVAAVVLSPGLDANVQASLRHIERETVGIGSVLDRLAPEQ